MKNTMHVHCTCTCTYTCVGLDTHVHALVSLLDWIQDRIPSWMATCLIMYLTQRLDIQCSMAVWIIQSLDTG